MGLKTAFTLLMALPQSILELALYMGKRDIQELDITCFYCGNFLTWADKILHAHCKLSIIWHSGGYYGCCHVCTLVTAKIDFMSNYERVMNVAEVELQADTHIEDLDVRCVKCLRLLNRTEKRDVALSDPDIFLIRGTFRTLCVVCRVGF